MAKDSRAKGKGWDPAAIKARLLARRLQEVEVEGRRLRAPWQYRNCLMGGRHTEKQGGNVSFQEFMFVPLSARSYLDAQRMTEALQLRLIGIVQESADMKFAGIGLEGGMVATYPTRPGEPLPEERALKVAVQAIKDCGLTPGVDVALALDPAASELSIAYRQHTGKKEAVGMYYFWRAEKPLTLSNAQMADMYVDWVAKYPIVSIEDGLSEDDPDGWRLLMERLGEKVFIIGDDLVTTKDSNILSAGRRGLMNTALIKANQIGTLSETILATDAAKNNGMALVVSHRSKSCNDTLEADVGFATDAMALKCGGGSNPERLIKYGRIEELLRQAQEGIRITRPLAGDLRIVDVAGREEPTNAGIPSVGVTVRLENGATFWGATPLGTSAGTDEAIHLVDSAIEKCAATKRFPGMFDSPDGGATFRFKKTVTAKAVRAAGHAGLSELWRRARRYDGKGCLNAVDNVAGHIAPLFVGKTLSELGGLVDVDRALLAAECALAAKRGKLPARATADQRIAAAQRKANLGMNAILPTSLALGRLIAARDAVELPDILRAMQNNIDRAALYGVK